MSPLLLPIMNNFIEYEKVNPKPKKLVVFVDVINHKFFILTND